MIDQVKVTPGVIEYTDFEGNKKKFFFQCNPPTLTRSRSVTRTDTKATNPAGTKTQRGEAGRKFTHDVSSWKLESLELWFDASMPYWTDLSNRSSAAPLTAVQTGIAHLEAICEPGPAPTENDHRTGAPPRPSPPLLTITIGSRSWQGFVSSVSILEKEFTPDLVPRQVKATLSFEIIETLQQQDQKKIGGKK